MLHVREKMQQAHKVARKHLVKSCQRRKQVYDSRAKVQTYESDDRVWYREDLRRGRFGIGRTYADEVYALSYSLPA